MDRSAASNEPVADRAAQRLRTLPATLAGALQLRADLAVDWDDPRGFHVDGVVGAAAGLLAAMIRESFDGLLMVVCCDQEAIDSFCDDLLLFQQRSPWRFPAWEMDRGERRFHDDIYAVRLSTLKQLRERGQPRPPILVTSAASLMQRVPSPADLDAATRRWAVGQTIDQVDMQRWLAEKGFHATSAVELPGEFAARGGILDIFAPDWESPVRCEWCDDQIESLRSFDIETQRSRESLTSVELTVLASNLTNREPLPNYCPPDSRVLLVEPDELERHAQQFVERSDDPEELLSWRQVQQAWSHCRVATCAAVSQAAGAWRLPCETVERFSGEIGRVRDELDAVAAEDQVFVCSQTDAEVQRLAEILGTTHAAAHGRLHFPVGYLSAGFRLLDPPTLVISGSELFRRGQLRRLPRRHLGKVIDSFLDLKEGDLVVHLSHGIARYRGLRMLDKDGKQEEHLELEFHGGTKVYVPAAKIELVQKYVGGAKSRPTLSRLGGKSWARQKQAAERAVLDLAADMLSLQAERLLRPGIKFAADAEWQLEFDASFPYQETDDQTAAIRSIKADMQTSRPMDRLLCGDVGFGKTEVAMRAAFKAVESGYQVAVLVPTTILAEQHYHSFGERMAEFPFDIRRLSRFCTRAEERETLEGLAAGRIDVVIGTHRLASKDVKFFNLGLVVIDEEQRFGVEVKERLKALRSTVDVLTMTATPIPRTLHMSLVGVRDISNLETPPEDRMAVETRLTRFDPDLIRHAVLRELNRGGQVFFVHNRVEDIEQLAFRLQHMVPEASIRIGHGQMPERELEQVMVDFVEHRFDLLLATTIVESGLDIPAANTIFIDEAHRYGLADLHQLRGRVGRYKHRAFCYLLVEAGKHLTPNAAKRLRAIEEYSELGAGFSLAMRDLEIRGAGNLLGTQQSGHIAAVGYELYCQLLETAVRQLKRLPADHAIDVDIELPGAAYLPSEYVPEIRVKIDLYRRFSRIADVAAVEELKRELRDRFGELPPPVHRMLALAELRIDAAIWHVSAVFVEDRYLVFRYVNRSRIEQLVRGSDGQLRVVDESSAYLTIPKKLASPEGLLQLAKSVLQPS